VEFARAFLRRWGKAGEESRAACGASVSQGQAASREAAQEYNLERRSCATQDWARRPRKTWSRLCRSELVPPNAKPRSEGEKARWGGGGVLGVEKTPGHTGGG